MLISNLLKSRLKPTERETCDILNSAFHYCGHGSDVLEPLHFIEIAFQGKPFTSELFEAARTYRHTLCELSGSQAITATNRLNWVLWHDVSKPDPDCYTGSIQRAIAAMDEEEAFAWQWLLRKTVPGFRPGTTWPVEAGRRLDALGRDRFIERLASLIVVPKQRTELGDAGANVLRLLVYYATLLPVQGVPILTRLMSIRWTDAMPAWQVYNALATLLALHPRRYRAEALELCRRYGATCYEVEKLQYIVDRPGFWKQKEQVIKDRENVRAALRKRSGRMKDVLISF